MYIKLDLNVSTTAMNIRKWILEEDVELFTKNIFTEYWNREISNMATSQDMDTAMDHQSSTADCEIICQDIVSSTFLSTVNIPIVQYYIIQDYTSNTNSIVLTITNCEDFQAVIEYFIENFTRNSLKRQNGIIIKTVYANLNVIVTVYNNANKIHLRGIGCKRCWEDVFIVTLNDLMMSSNSEKPITSSLFSFRLLLLRIN